jgi:hypothetical protein
MAALLRAEGGKAVNRQRRIEKLEAARAPADAIPRIEVLFHTNGEPRPIPMPGAQTVIVHFVSPEWYRTAGEP